MELSKENKKYLLNLSRETIRILLYDNKIYNPEKPNSDVLNSNGGVFVTLKNSGRLRGCIGRFNANYPIYLVVRDMSIESSSKDYRFPKLRKDELDDIEIEISVLSPLKKIDNIKEFELGKHGIYMVKGGMSGTFLPQVAKETGWNLENFLGHCSRDKMGLGWNDWKTSDLFIYEAIIFNEKEM